MTLVLPVLSPLLKIFKQINTTLENIYLGEGNYEISESVQNTMFTVTVSNIHRRTGNFFAPGGGTGRQTINFAQKILASCPNFCETVGRKRGPYDATT